MKKMLACFLALMLLPSAVLAVEGGVVEEAPPVNLQEQIRLPDETQYFPDADYYNEDFQPPFWEEHEAYEECPYDGSIYYETALLPGLTKGEKARAEKLLAAYEKGEKKGDGASVLNQTENVVLSVLEVDPSDFAGEKVYVILPGTCLTDEELLSLMDAYHRLGLTFDPDGLSCMNCVRGGSIEASRFMTDEERNRRLSLRDQIERGVLPANSISSDEKSGYLKLTLNGSYYSGLTEFDLYPYRALTDEELIHLLLSQGVYDKSGEVNKQKVERLAREALTKELHLPVSMDMVDFNTHALYLPYTFNDAGEEQYLDAEDRKAYVLTFQAADRQGKMMTGSTWVDAKTEKVLKSCVSASSGFLLQPETMDEAELPSLSRETYLSEAKKYASEVLGIGAEEWHDKGRAEVNGTPTEKYSVRYGENGWLNIYLKTEDGEVFSAEIKEDIRKVLLDAGETITDQVIKQPQNQ